jgi:hypothetical protein
MIPKIKQFDPNCDPGEEEDTYLVGLSICGIIGTVYLEVPASSYEEAWRSAQDSIQELDQGDCGVESVSVVLEPQP